MSKLIFYFMSWLVLTLGVILYQQIKTPSIEHFIVVKSLYVDEDGASLIVPIFMDVKGELTHKETVISASLQNELSQLSLTFVSVILKHEEFYNDQTYYLYEMTFSLPSLNDHFMMRHAILHIQTINENYQFLIGHVERYLKHESQPFLWEEIEAFRYRDFFSIETIEIDTTSRIEAVWVSNFLDVLLLPTNNGYQVQFLIDDVMVNKVPLLIHHENGIEVISSVNYIHTPILLIQTEQFHEYYINELS